MTNHKDNTSLYPPMHGYTLGDEQMKTIKDVCKALIEAESYLDQDSTDNTMEHYGDFLALYTMIHRALDQGYHIMSVHNTTEHAHYLAKEEEWAVEHSKRVKEFMKK